MKQPVEVKTQEFTSIVGENYTTIRNVYGRPGREPRMPGPDGEVDFAARRQRRYIFADAVAWRFTRHLSSHSLDWDTAAQIINREMVADYLVGEFGGEGARPGQFFAIWPVTTDGKTQWAAWRGDLSEIVEVIEHDTKAGEVGAVLMVSCDKVLSDAVKLAEEAGYEVIKGHLVARKD